MGKGDFTMEIGKEMIMPNNIQMDKVCNVKKVTIPAGSLAIPMFRGIKSGNIYIESDSSIVFGRKPNSPETMPNETNTYLYSDNGEIRLSIYNNGQRVDDIGIMEDIADVQVMNNRAIIITFTDGSTEKAVLDNNDFFNIEQGIAICLMKKSFSKISNGNGSSVYNKLVEYALRVCKDIEIAKLNAETEKKNKDEKAMKNAEKAKRKRERKAAEKREAEIEIQKEAYLRAMREFNRTSNTVAAK